MALRIRKGLVAWSSRCTQGHDVGKRTWQRRGGSCKVSSMMNVALGVHH